MTVVHPAKQTAQPAASQAEASVAELSELFERNRAWAKRKTQNDPDFFQRLVAQQRPRYFWIGCSDSRVPATEIVDLDPGEMFVHRNVANLANPSDPNFAAVLQFAVDVLEVSHIIVVGHYGCGGIRAAMHETVDDPIGRWLAPLREIYDRQAASLKGEDAGANGLCRHNVELQVAALAGNTIVNSAWSRGAALTIHGWVYAIGDGYLQPVCPPIGAATS